MKINYNFAKVLAMSLVMCAAWVTKSRANVDKDLKQKNDTTTVDKHNQTIHQNDTVSMNKATQINADNANGEISNVEKLRNVIKNAPLSDNVKALAEKIPSVTDPDFIMKLFCITVQLEDFKARVYDDAGKKGGGTLTIGAGYVYVEGKRVTRKTPPIRTDVEAVKMFIYFYNEIIPELAKKMPLEKATSDQIIGIFLKRYQQGPGSFAKYIQPINNYLENPNEETAAALPQGSYSSKFAGLNWRRKYVELAAIRGDVHFTLNEAEAKANKNTIYVLANRGGFYKARNACDLTEFCYIANTQGTGMNSADTVYHEVAKTANYSAYYKQGNSRQGNNKNNKQGNNKKGKQTSKYNRFKARGNIYN